MVTKAGKSGSRVTGRGSRTAVGGARVGGGARVVGGVGDVGGRRMKGGGGGGGGVGGPGLEERTLGVLMHVTSLPGALGCGDAGPSAWAFVDRLSEMGVRWWQMLPTHPVGGGPGYSPYSSPSAFAMSPLVVSPELMVAEGLLSKKDLKAPARLGKGPVQYAATIALRTGLLRKAFAAWRAGHGSGGKAFKAFVERERHWIGDWALFATARARYREAAWTTWDAPLARREPQAMRALVHTCAEDLDYHVFVQYMAERHWAGLRAYANGKGIGLIGDVPIFVSHDSADVWARRELFRLDSKGHPIVISGVPPDAFSDVGQKWGHPHYDWAAHGREKYRWWVDRFCRVLGAFDAVRIDHFLGFYRTWAIPAGRKDAKVGKWVMTPGDEIFTALKARMPGAKIIAEDLGIPTEGATKLREKFGFPGMRVLHFGFDGGCEHLPWRYGPNCVAYTGTHDNETSVQWLGRVMKQKKGEKRGAETLGLLRPDEAGAWQMVGMVANSVANTAIVPMQDLLGLDGAHRMNVPGTVSPNWQWRMEGAVPKDVIARTRHLVTMTGRDKR